MSLFCEKIAISWLSSEVHSEPGAGSDGGQGPAVKQSRLSAADQLRRSSPTLSLAAWVISRSNMQSGDLQRVLEVVEGVSARAQPWWAHHGRVQRHGLEGLDAMSSHLRRRGAVLPAVARFHGEEARGCAGSGGGRSRMARRLGVLVGSVCCGVAVLLPFHDSVRNHPMQRTRGHRHAWWRARWSRAFDQGRSAPSLSLAA
jgi:hypothetical protein